MSNPTSLGDLVVSPTLDESRFWADFGRLQQQVQREGVKLNVDNHQALSATDRVKKDLEALGNLTARQASEQTRAAKVLGAEYQASMRKVQEQNAAVIASYREQQAATQARTAQLRQESAQVALSARLSAQADREAAASTRAAMQTRQEAIAQLRLDYSRLRASLDGNTISQADFNRGGDKILTTLKRIGAEAGFTAQQLKQLSDLEGRINREQNTLAGVLNPVGLSGNTAVGLRAALPDILRGFQQVTALSPSLGAAANHLSFITDGLNTAGHAAGFMGTGAASAEGAVAALGSAAGVAGAVVGGLTAVLVAGGAAANKAANEYGKLEYNIAQVSTLTDKTPAQMESTGRSVLNLSRKLGMGYEDIAEGLRQTIGASVRGTEDMGQALAFTQDAAKLAVAGNTSTAASVDLLSSVMNAYKLNATQTRAVSDGLFAAVRDGKMEVNELAQSMGLVTAIAADLNVPLAVVNASLATMTASGIKTSSAVDYLRGMMNAIQKPSSEAATLADSLHLKFNAQALAAKGLVRFLEDVITATKGNKEQMAILFGGVEALTAATSLASGNFGRLKTNLDNQAKSAGATETAYAKMAGTLKKENDRLDANWKSLWANAGSYFAPFKTEVLGSLNEMLEGINTFIERLNLARNAAGAGNRVLRVQDQIKGLQDMVAIGEHQLKDPMYADRSDAWRADVKRRIAGARAEIQTLQAELTQLQADATVAKAEQTRYNVQNSKATLPTGVQGPNMGGAGGAAQPIQVITGRDLVTLLGMGGRTVLNEFGVSGANYHHDGAVSANAVHNGIDYAAPRGSAILAPFSGELTVREDKKNGKIFELVDAAGNKLVGIHLDAFDQAVLAALEAGGGRALIGQGTRIGGVGNSGTTAGSAPHLHLMGYAAGSKSPVNPTSLKFNGYGTPDYGVDGTQVIQPSAPTTASTKDLKDYNLTLADWNKNQARALELAREAAKAETDLTGKRGLEVAAAMRAWAGEDKARQASYQLAVKLEQLRNRKPELTDLQREQQQQQDAVAQQRMEASLRAASAKRLRQLVDGGVTPEVSLAKWQAAQAEIKRRQDAADKDEKKRDEDRKVAGQNRLAAERALVDGQFELADRTAGLVIKTYDRQVKGAGDSAATRLEIEERLGADVLAARETQARVAAQQEKARLERERNTAVNATGLTLTQRQKLWNQYGDKIRQVDADLAEALLGIQDEATRQMADLQQKAFSEENVGKAEAYADRLRATIASLPGQDEEGLITVYGEARAARDQELLAAVYDEWERRRLQAEEDARVVAQIQSEANLSAAQAGVATAEQMISEGDTEGALQFLSDLSDGFQAMSDQGEDAVDAINFVIDAVNRLSGASVVSDEFNSFVSQLSGTIDEQIGQVVDRLEEVTDPALRAKLQGLLKDLRADMPKYADPYAAGYVPGTNGFVSTGDAPDLEEVASARDLGTLLNETTDPAQVQVLMGEVVDLLASEIGQRLPDTIRTGLEESVKGAQGYLDALAQITEDGIVDGWERAGKVALQNPVPTNRFSDFSSQIFALGADGLSDPTQYDALTAALQQARAESQLTEADLQNLLALIEELRNPKTPEIGKAFDLGQWQQDIQTLTDDFDAGRMTAGEYSSGLRDAAVQLNDLADEAERMGNLKLAGQFRELAGSLRAMTPEIAAMLKGLGKVQEYAGYVQDLAGAFSALAEATGNEDLVANLNGLGNLAGKVAALAGDVMRIIANPADIGAWVGAITKVVSGIAEAMNGYRQAYAQAKQMQDDFNKRFALINGNDFAKTTVRSRGWLADTFGGGPEVKQVVDEFGLKIAQAIEGGVMGGIKSGMKQALSTGDWTNFSNTFRQSAYDGVVDGLIEAIFNDALKEILAPGIKALTDAAKTESTADDDAAITELERGLGQAEQFLTRAGQRIQPGLDRLRNDLGITTPGNTGGVDTTGLSTLPEPIQFELATPLLEGVRGIKDAADILKEGAVIIRDTFKGGMKVTVQQGSSSYTSTTGTLV